MDKFDNTLEIDNSIIESIENMIKTQNYKFNKVLQHYSKNS